MNDLMPSQTPPEPHALAALLLNGDLSKLKDTEILGYYQALCRSLGLNPLTKPFDWITLNNRKVLYATRNCTDQLRYTRRINLKITDRQRVEGLCLVTAQAMLPDGRCDESIGAVPCEVLKGDALANALMRAETKAKRRVTLSICGLSFPDASEVETIAGAPPLSEPIPLVPEGLVSTEELTGAQQKALERHEKHEEKTGPFVDSISPAAASPAVPAEASSAAADSAPDEKRRQAQLLKAIAAQLKRLVGTSKQDALDLSRDIWGKGIETFASLKDVPNEELQRGLDALTRMQKDEPPPVEGDARPSRSPASDTSSVPGAEGDVPMHRPPTPAPTVTMAPTIGGPPEDITGRGPFGEISALGDARLNDLYPNEHGDKPSTADRVPESQPEAFTVKPPENPRIIGGDHGSPLTVADEDVQALMVWAHGTGHQETFDTMVEGKPMRNDLPILSRIAYGMILHYIAERLPGKVPA